MKTQKGKKTYGKKNYTRNNRDYSGSDSGNQTQMTHNDWRWYVDNDQMLRDVASLPFSQVLGLDTGILKEPTSHTTLPGIMVIHAEPCVGAGKTAVDAATLSARRIYTFVRHANSGSANYEAPDLMMMILAYASAEAWLQTLKRVYGLARNYYTKNRYYADRVIQACGFDPKVIRDNITQLRAHINISCARLNSIKVPAGMPIVERWKWLCGGVFMDDDAIKAQTYIYKFDRFMRYSSTTSEAGTELRYPEVPAANAPIHEIYAYTETLLNSLLSEEDVGIMSGDILKAYGGSVTTESLIEDNYTVLPSHDTEVLMQIHNSFTPIVGRQYSHETVQDGGIIKDVITFKTNANASNFADRANGLYLDLYTKDPTPEQVIVATRNMGVYNFTSATDGEIVACGSEFITGYEIFDMNSTYNVNNILTAAVLSEIVAASAFNWHPLFYFVTAAGVYQGILGDIENYTILPPVVLESMHRNALFAETRTATGN